MGVFDFVKEGAREMRVARGSDGPVSVHVEDSLPLYGELDVERDDCAVFVRDARAIGILGPGRHALHISNIPFLALAHDVGEREGRIRARVVFVRLTPIVAQPFSGKLEEIIDPLTHVPPSLEGTLTVQIVDPAEFVEDHLRSPKRPLFARPGVAVSVDALRLRQGDHVGRVATHAFVLPAREPEANEERGAAIDCRACGTRGEIGAFCEGCGTLLSARARCVACRAPLEPNARFCAGCGVRTDV